MLATNIGLSYRRPPTLSLGASTQGNRNPSWNDPLGKPAVCSFATMTFGGAYVGYDSVRFWGSVLFFTVALPGLFEVTRSVRWLNLVGDLSYPIYLVHTSVLILLGPLLVDFALPLNLLPPVEAGYVALAAFLAATTLVALVIHKAVEVPVAHAMHRLAGRPQLRPLL
ncbi:MAG: acyltransferase family protein [Reyranella sp.]